MPRQIYLRESLLNSWAAQMLQFVRIAHDINGGDLAIFDFERGGLQDTLFDGYESGQAVDETVAH